LLWLISEKIATRSRQPPSVTRQDAHHPMYTPLIIVVALLLLGGTAYWAIARSRRIRAEAARREEDALARVRAGASPFTLDGETVFAEAGTPSRIPDRRGLEVSEHDEVFDIEALLAGEPQGVARRARATLEEPTNIILGDDTLPPRRAVPAAEPAPAAPPAVPSGVAMPVRTPAPVPAPVAAAPAGARPPQPSPPTLVMRVPGDPGHAAPAPLPAPAAVRDSAAVAPVPAGGGAPIRRGNEDVPLRELALAWFEARGYRSAPASAAVRPIEQVLRHRHDPARAYAFVVESGRVTADRVQQLRTQARSIGLLRVLIVANDGSDEGAALKSKGVRLMDRTSLAAEFDQLDFSVAAKIIAVARKRSAAPITVS